MMKRKIFVLLAAIFTLSCFADEDALLAKRWSVERANAWYDARPWIRGCNFMPSNCANRIDMWQKHDAEAHFAAAERELARASEIGFNSIRIIMDYYVWKDEHDSYMENLERFLTIADKHHITCLVVFANDCLVPKEEYVRPKMGEQEVHWGYHGNKVKSPHRAISRVGWSILDDPELKADFYKMVREIMTKYAKDERIIVWDLFNEPGNNGRGKISGAHIRELFAIGREIDPIQPLTSDVWKTLAYITDAEKESLKYSDVISYHCYHGLAAQIAEIAELKKMNRPLFCTEYLHRIAGDDIKEDFPLFYLEKVACYNWGFVAGKYQTYEPWGVYWQMDDEGKADELDFTKWQHDLLRPNLRPYDPKEIRLITDFCRRADADWAEKQNQKKENELMKKSISTQDLQIRDPFVLVDRENQRYILYRSNGHGVDAYLSCDLKSWQFAKTAYTPDDKLKDYGDFWAPEVHFYQGKYYLFLTLTPEGGCRGTWCFRSDSPLGPFERFSETQLTPIDWFALDGTLLIDRDNKPYLVFCHEWVQIHNGTICAVALSDDLSRPIGEPFLLFGARDAAWAIEKGEDKHRITDGPFLYRAKDGALLMLWSGFAADGYVTAVAKSSDGTLRGKWSQMEKLFFDQNGGHAMIFTALDGTPTALLHAPNRPAAAERMVFCPVIEKDGSVVQK